jgi:hypothetical protein
MEELKRNVSAHVACFLFQLQAHSAETAPQGVIVLFICVPAINGRRGRLSIAVAGYPVLAVSIQLRQYHSFGAKMTHFKIIGD